MATTVTQTSQAEAASPGPDLTEAFVADRQAFWGSFTSFVTMAALGIALLLIVLAFFLG